MEQTILSVDKQRWVSAIVKLTTLTYQGKLVWQKSSREAVSDLFTSFVGAEPPTRYTVADRNGQQFVLVVSSYPRYLEAVGLPLNAHGESNTSTHFEVWKSGKKIFRVSNLTVLNALADAVSSQDKQYEEEALSAIENLAV